MKLDIETLLHKSLKTIVASGKYAQEIRYDIYKDGFLPFDLNELITTKENLAESEDLLMSKFLHKKISSFSDIPIISEETHTRLNDDTFWCVDPLDGSFCFSHNTGPYSILISLIYRGKPVLGVANFPEQNTIYLGSVATGSYIIKKEKQKKLIYHARSHINNLRGIITNATPDPEPIRQYLNQFGITKFTDMLGAPNPAMLLCGLGDVMPLFHRQYEWDIAAYDAILRYANPNQKSAIVDLYGNPILYGKQDNNRPFENPKLIATYNQKIINQICETNRQKKL